MSACVVKFVMTLEEMVLELRRELMSRGIGLVLSMHLCESLGLRDIEIISVEDSLVSL